MDSPTKYVFALCSNLKDSVLFVRSGNSLRADEKAPLMPVSHYNESPGDPPSLCSNSRRIPRGSAGDLL